MNAPDPEILDLIRSFRLKFGRDPGPNDLDTHWLAQNVPPALVEKFAIRECQREVGRILDEMVADGRARIVGTDDDGQPLYEIVPEEVPDAR